MFKKFKAFEDWRRNKSNLRGNRRLNNLISKYTFLYVTKNLEIEQDLKIIQNINNSSVIVINCYSYKEESPNAVYFFICFRNTLIIIKQTFLYILKQLLMNFSKEKIEICFLSNSKTIFDQFVSIKYQEVEANKYFQEEISKIYKNFFIKNTEFPFWHHIKLCISGYLLQQSYKDLNYDRIQAFYSNANKKIISREMNLDEFIELREVGNGSSFKTTLFYHISDEKLVIIKIPYIADSKKYVDREIQNYQKLKNPFIPKFYGTIKYEKQVCPIIEFINGELLYNAKNIQYSKTDRITILIQLLSVIEYFHENHCIYRDLKPNNVIIDKNKNIVVIDYDRMIEDNTYSNGTDEQQTIDFASNFHAPEINSKNLTNKCDIFSFGKIINEIFPEMKNNQKYISIFLMYLGCINEKPEMRPPASNLYEFIFIFLKTNNITLYRISPYIHIRIANLFVISNNANKAIHYYSLAAHYNIPYAQFTLGVFYEKGKFISQDIKKAIHYYSLAAKQNYSDAQFNLGLIYYENKYIERDINKAIHYYSLAADQNHPKAQFYLGLIYCQGKYIPRNINKSIQYYSLAAKRNISLAQYNLGNIYSNGKYIPCEIDKAIYYFELASKNKYPQAQYNLGLIYEKGEYIQQDINKAIHYYSLASKQKYLQAQFKLGLIYYENKYIAQDINKAIIYFSDAANQNHSEAQFILGVIYEKGKYVPRDINKSIHYYSLAADQNHLEAQFILGVIYEKGEYIQRDINKAIHYFSLAAKQNNPKAIYNLGQIYYTNEFIPRDIEKAIDYFSLAAKQKIPEALFILGVIYKEGRFVNRDINKAIRYYLAAASQNHLDALFNLGVIYYEGILVPRDIYKAIHYFTIASNRKFSKAQYNLGKIYYTNEFIPRDINKAIKYFHLASEQNDSMAQFALALIYEDNKYVKRDIDKTIHYYSLAADQNHSDAQYNLGLIYYKGKYVSQNINKAMYYYLKASNLNQPQAQFFIGIIYYLGLFVQQNINRGIYWITRSSNNRFSDANFSLGFLYHEGKHMKQDINQSVHFYKEASSFNNQYAKNNLGIIYKYGFNDIIEKNSKSAKVYFKESIKQKNDPVSMYNLAHIYIFEDSTEKSINKSIDLLIKSSDQNFKPSTKLLFLILMKKYQMNKTKIKKELSKASESTKKHISSLTEKIKNRCDASEVIDEKYNNYKSIDFIYNFLLQPIASKEIFKEKTNENIENQNEKYNITDEFYDGFGH